MLKHIKIYTLLLVTIIIISCSNDNEVEPLFDQDVDSRVEETLKNYKEILVNSEFGWKADYQPQGETGIYNLYIKFNSDSSAEIVSDYDNGKNDLPTSYRIGKSQFPELVFENYSVLHSLFEAESFRLGAEFEFIIEKVSSDAIILKSKTDQGEEKSTLTLIKANATDKEDIKQLQGLDKRIENGYLTDLFFRRLTVVNTNNSTEVFKSSFTFDNLTRISTITFLDSNNTIQVSQLPIEVTKEGFNFLTPFIYQGTEFTSFTYNQMNNVFESSKDQLKVEISHGTTPGLLFYPEVNAFGEDFKSYVYFDNTSANFLTLTSDDFLNLGLSSSFSRIDIVFDDINNGGISYFIFSMNDGSNVFVVFEDEIIADERFVFNFSNVFGDPTEIIGVLNILLNPQGFYIEKTNESRFTANPSFLLISVADPNFRFSVYGI